jgi:hypothetical protein
LLARYYNGPLSDLTAARVRDFLSRFFVEQSGAQFTSPKELISALAHFFQWAEKNTGYRFTSEQREILSEMESTLPRAMEIFSLLSRHLSERGGAFGFAEFLTSFEEGGRSRYDFDAPDQQAAMEGYFRILKIDGSLIEAEETITESRVYPIIFPEEVARLLEMGFVINLELARSKTGWQIVACGFVYPPGTGV